MPTFSSLDELKDRVGEDLGSSSWTEITQEQVNQFADATHDHQWIHLDAERAKAGPFGTTIAHGYLTLSLISGLLEEVLAVEGVQMAVNYGLEKVRFPAPVPVGSKVRLAARLLSAEDVAGGGVQIVLQCTLEREGGDKPVCVAQPVFRWYR
jgi:acyl dehydratase